jgi:hypothetical protein
VEIFVMSRFLCLALILGGLVAAPGCSSCSGGNACRRSSFMEFRSPCRGQADPCHAPVCEPACGPACGSPCNSCGEGGGIMSGPSSAPVVGEPGTFS